MKEHTSVAMTIVSVVAGIVGIMFLVSSCEMHSQTTNLEKFKACIEAEGKIESQDKYRGQGCYLDGRQI